MLNAFLNSSIVSAIKLGNNSISKIFLGNNLVFRDPPNCPEGQILDLNTGDCYYNVSTVTPIGTNVTLNPLSQQETGISLGLSITFQEVTTQGTTTFREFPSATNPTTNFRGIQIDTTASFVGDIDLTFLLPNDISLIDFNNLSVFSLIDSTNITASRDYASKIIQAKISYTQGQSLSIMAGGGNWVGGGGVVLTSNNCNPQTEIPFFYFVYGLPLPGFGGWYSCCRPKQCPGYGNEYLANSGADACSCKCTNGMNVCFDPTWTAGSERPLTWNCLACAPGKIFWPSGQNTVTGCDCKCASGCSSWNTIRDNDCNCRCEAGYAKCGQTIRTKSLDGQSYEVIEEKCCQPRWTCAGIPSGQTEGECCPPDKAPCNGICCQPGQNCCGGVCCDVGYPCINNECCHPDKVCGGGTQCCKSTELCINGSCCPTSRIYENLGVPDCCSVGYIVDVTGSSCVEESPTWVCKGANQGCGLCYNDEHPNAGNNPAPDFLPNCSSIRGAGATYAASSQEECELYCLKSVTFWRCVSGGNCMSETDITEGGRVPINSDYYATESLCRDSCS